MNRYFVAVILSASVTGRAFAANLVATYEFNNNFDADQAGVAALVPSDPLGMSAFVADVVLGQPRQVWAFNGNADPPTNQAGLTANTTGLVAPTNYSVDMVFLFSQGDNAWRRIIDIENRQSDFGFYVDPDNNLAVFPVIGSTAPWTNNVYHHVVLTNDGVTVSGYLDGISQFAETTSLLNLNNANNPGLLMNFFLDDTASDFTDEFSNGRVALIRLWDGVLTAEEAMRLAANPFVAEPSTIVLASIALVPLLIRRFGMSCAQLLPRRHDLTAIVILHFCAVGSIADIGGRAFRVGSS